MRSALGWAQMAAVRRECLVGLLIIGRNHLDRVFARLAMAWARRNCEKQQGQSIGAAISRDSAATSNWTASARRSRATRCRVRSRPTRRSVVDPPVDEADPD